MAALFLIGTILAILDLQVTPMLPTKFQVNWPSGSGEEAKNRFSRWPRPSAAIMDFWLELFYLFLIYKSPWCFLQSFKLIGLSVQKKKRKIHFQDGMPQRPSSISYQNNFSYFWSTSHPDASYQVSSQLPRGVGGLKQLLTLHAGKGMMHHGH